MSEIAHPPPPEAALPPISCLGFDRAPSPGALKGWATLHLPRFRLKLVGCACFSANDKDWVVPPAREVGRDADGKPRWAPVLEWDSRDIQAAFSTAAVQALDAYCSSWREGGR